MKKETFISIAAFLLLIFFFISCNKINDNNSDPQPPPSDKPFENMIVAEDFTWVTSTTLAINLLITDDDQNPVQTNLQVYSEYPNGELLLEGTSSQNGVFKRKYKIASSKNKIVVVIPNNNPVEISFVDTTVNNVNALLAKKTITVTNSGYKASREEVYTYYPADGKFGTICFEDYWPKSGDYDFNDAVIDYNVVAVSDAASSDYVERIEMTLYLRAKGAGYQNGFGISFRYYWSGQGPYHDIASVIVNGNQISGENTIYPSYMIIPNLTDALPYFNTKPEQDLAPPVRFDVVITFAEPIDNWDLEFPLQNPFLIVNQDRGREIHIPGDLPTSLANPDYVGTEDDDSDPSVFEPGSWKSTSTMGYVTYVTEYDFPWVINIYEGPEDQLFSYPAENQDISESYSSFTGWVTNWDPQDWYMPEYIIPGKVYPYLPDNYVFK